MLEKAGCQNRKELDASNSERGNCKGESHQQIEPQAQALGEANKKLL
jgi:hypothetical protein